MIVRMIVRSTPKGLLGQLEHATLLQGRGPVILQGAGQGGVLPGRPRGGGGGSGGSGTGRTRGDRGTLQEESILFRFGRFGLANVEDLTVGEWDRLTVGLEHAELVVGSVCVVDLEPVQDSMEDRWGILQLTDIDDVRLRRTPNHPDAPPSNRLVHHDVLAASSLLLLLLLLLCHLRRG